MKKTVRIITTIALIVAILLCTAWYLFVYDRDFTKDMLLTCARKSESSGHHTIAAWFYDLAYAQSDNSDAVAIELAQQYKDSGNYTKAEFTLYNAISDGGGVDLYITLSKLYVEQDKLLDAVNMLNGVTDPQVKAKLDAMRPATPTSTPTPEDGKTYNSYISVTLSSSEKSVYYTTDGQYPSTQGPVYSKPIQLPGGETKIQAVSVNSLGLVSQLGLYNYVIADVVEPVEFSDPAVESAVRTLLNASEDKQLYTNDLWLITEFTVPLDAKSLADLPRFAFLEKLTIGSNDTTGVTETDLSDDLVYIHQLKNLTELSITGVSVSREVLNGIAQLPLQKLTLSGCNLSNISDLESCLSITVLDLSNNQIGDIKAISAMAELRELNLQGNALKDLNALSSNNKLTVLNVSQNGISALGPITALTALTKVDASKNNINDLGNIKNLNNLTVLLLTENSLTNTSQLAEHPSIEELDISTNQLTDISHLGTMHALKYLNCSNNAITTLPIWEQDCALVSINASRNNLVSIDGLSGLKHLNVVNIEYNIQVESVATLSKCPVLLEVYMHGTAATDIESLKAQGIVLNYDPIESSE